MIFVGEDGENMIGVAPGANHRLTPGRHRPICPQSLFRKDDVLLVSLEIPVETAIRALRRGFEAEMRTDPESGTRAGALGAGGQRASLGGAR